MDNKTILDYVLNSPENTNPAILNQMLDELKESSSTELWTVTFKADTGYSGECAFGYTAWDEMSQEPTTPYINSLDVNFLAGTSVSNLPFNPTTNWRLYFAGYTTESLDNYVFTSDSPNIPTLVQFPYTPTNNNETLYAVYFDDN